VTFSLDLDAEMFAKALEANIRGVLGVVVLFVRKLREAILGNIIGAHDARLARNRDSLAGSWLLASVVGIVLAFAFDAIESGCCGCITAWRRCQPSDRCHCCWIVEWLEVKKMLGV
jgi:hypothetical protein